MARILKTGIGWRLGWNEAAPQFPGLVGSDDWAFELTRDEFQDFCRLFIQLTDSVEQIADELMDAEQLQCEVESEHVWLEAFGEPQAYSLKIILNQDRGAEGTWPTSAIAPLLQAVQSIHVF
jgi:hypothetical protein